ncbi:CapA family protein [Jeotgalibacillus haloalkalitolerans]|uniref:CapA family protein n=1 Tax=Jeotgalibacillus haloalkalitolerans TaxID=3104292 RepID=A0ABU5KNR1_9BACL|nr:CapA family protein [Jeotgalibacillus sp. HH7-29]MDZ5712893.1 CapA family protein [Jeotgalibacillus sp. HH7-29]
MSYKILSAVFLLVIVSACSADFVSVNTPDPGDDHSGAVNPVLEKDSDYTNLIQKAHFTAVGDLLVERPILFDAMQKDGTFNFDPLLSNVKHLIQKGDFVYANQETPITGSEYGLGDGDFVFNNPYELGHYYYETGFNMLQLANNHTLDMGYEGLERNLAFWENHYPDVALSGVYPSSDEAREIPVIDKNGISVALISSTYNSNLPVEYPDTVNIFTENEERLINDVTRAEEIADVVAVGIHWGNEYQQPVQEQEELAQKLVNNGADIILGHHPHILQPIEWLEGPDDQPALVAYSLGNFISGPFDDRVPHLDCERLTGAMIGFDLVKQGEKVSFESVYAVPTFTSFTEDFSDYQILPLDEFEQDEFRWCDLPVHKNNVIKTLSERTDLVEIRMNTLGR